VERELVNIGAVKSVVATDISESLTDFARKKAADLGDGRVPQRPLA
jgi:methylase of polypeptide subunit release factors